MVIAISIIGAKDVGPVQNHLQKDELAHMPNPVKCLNRAIATYQLSANVVQFPYIDAELLRNHCKVSHQDKNRRHLDHVLTHLRIQSMGSNCLHQILTLSAL